MLMLMLVITQSFIFALFIRSPIVIACLQKNMTIIQALIARNDIILNRFSYFKKDIDSKIFEMVDKRREELGQEPMQDVQNEPSASSFFF